MRKEKEVPSAIPYVDVGRGCLKEAPAFADWWSRVGCLVRECRRKARVSGAKEHILALGGCDVLWKGDLV